MLCGNEPHNTHFNIEEALDFISLVQPQKAYLTHISHLMWFHDEVQKMLPKMCIWPMII